MANINFPKNLPKSKEGIYINIINKEYDKIIILIHKLGNICTLDQFIRLYSLINKNLSKTYADKKAREIIKEMTAYKLIEVKKLNKYKYFYLKKFSFAIIYKDYNTNKSAIISKMLKDGNFRRNLMKVEYYIENRIIISVQTLNSELLKITKDILSITTKDTSLKNYNKDLLSQILNDGNADKYIDYIKELPEDNLIRIVWLDFYNIFNSLRLQNQTITSLPTYYKFFKRNNQLILHYVPNIVIFDTHDKNYYHKKIQDLFLKFFQIQSNHTNEIRNNYIKNGTLGFKGFNHFAYTLTILGSDKLELKAKKEYIDNKINENPNGIILNVTTELIDISKYLKEESTDTEIFEKIDSTFDMLINSKQ